MLDAIGTGATHESKKDWAEIWNRSDEYRQVAEEVEILCKQGRATDAPESLMDGREYAISWITQMAMVIRRTFASYWRDPNYLLGKCVCLYSSAD